MTTTSFIRNTYPAFLDAIRRVDLDTTGKHNRPKRIAILLRKAERVAKGTPPTVASLDETFRAWVLERGERGNAPEWCEEAEQYLGTALVWDIATRERKRAAKTGTRS